MTIEEKNKLKTKQATSTYSQRNLDIAPTKKKLRLLFKKAESEYNIKHRIVKVKIRKPGEKGHRPPV